MLISDVQKYILDVRTDGAPFVLDHTSGFHAYVEQAAPNCLSIHCMTYCETLASKIWETELMKVLQHVIKIVNSKI